MEVILLMLWMKTAMADANETSESKDELARERYEAGTMLYEEGRYEDAVLALQEAYKLSERHALLFNIAAAQERMGDFPGALETLYTYRIYAPPEEQDILKRRIDNLRERIEKAEANEIVEAPPAPPPVEEPQEEKESVVPPEVVVKKQLSPWVSTSLLGVGAGATTIGLVYTARFYTTRNELMETCPNKLCNAEAEQIKDTSKHAAMVADITTGVAIVSAGTGIILAIKNRHVSLGVNGIRYQRPF